MNQLEDFAGRHTVGQVIEIKLRDLLGLRPLNGFAREIVTRFPPITIGSVTLVDQVVLLCLEELVNPRTILEIGTFQGFTTALLACNSKASRIFSVDLPSTGKHIIENPDLDLVLADGHYNDNYLRDIQNATGEIYLECLEERTRKRVELVKADSTQLDFGSTFGTVEMAFIDGGHDEPVIRSDTANTLKILRKGVIVWHDYASGIHSDVSRFLAEHARSNRVFHITGSLCAFQVVP